MTTHRPHCPAPECVQTRDNWTRAKAEIGRFDFTFLHAGKTYDTKAEDHYREATELLIAHRRAQETGWLRRAWRWLMAPLTCVALTISAPAVEVPDALLSAVAMVESGVNWHPGQQLTCALGHCGEASIWQLSPAVLCDLHTTPAYVHAHPAVAERLTRLWLSRLYARTGTWSLALAAYHAGRHLRMGRDYARRVLAIAKISRDACLQP